MTNDWMSRPLSDVDPDVAQAIANEERRQHEGLELIASENFVSEAVLEAAGSVFTNKYAEGYPRKRYYGGCEFTDVVEQAAIDRARELFNADHANVQPHSGSQANMAVYLAALSYGDTILGMNLSHGGHLTHGHPLNFSGFSYKVVEYGVSRETEQIDYDELERLAQEHNPRLIVCGASAYPRTIDFERIGEIARSIGAKVMADIAHIAGPVAAGLHPSPVPHADYVTTTTHKTLRGPRGGLILCREEHAQAIDRVVFPMLQGGPHLSAIAGKAVCFREAMQPEFRDYASRIVENCRALADGLLREGLTLWSGGTDNHLLVIELRDRDFTGAQFAEALESAGIIVSKSTIPGETRSPRQTSGVRLGTPALTTRGATPDQMRRIAGWIGRV